MFIREAKISALLLHPNIVQIYEFGQAEGAYFIAMESVQGVTLREALTTLRKEQRAMPFMIAADITRQICIGPRLRPQAARPRRHRRWRSSTRTSRPPTSCCRSTAR